MTIDVIQKILLNNMIRIDVLGKYAEGIKSKISECEDEFLEIYGDDTSNGSTLLHLKAISLIADDMLNLVDNTAKDFNNI